MPIEREDLLRRIDVAVPKWRQDAEAETAVNREARCHASKKEIWREKALKQVFVDHQRKKCAFCEAKIDPREAHVEHFRPKGRINAWSDRGNGIKRTGKASKTGYFLLAFDPSNYLAACAQCNVTWKKTYFPVLRRRMLSATEPAELAREKPYLLHPLDASDDPPETLFGFQGVTPRILAADKRRRRRALITIELLKLHDRETLSYARAQIVWTLWRALDEVGDPARGPDARRLVEVMMKSGSPFTNCARSYKSLYESDRAEAERFAGEAWEILVSQS
jgi:hypothetical protein